MLSGSLICSLYHELLNQLIRITLRIQFQSLYVLCSDDLRPVNQKILVSTDKESLIIKAIYSVSRQKCDGISRKAGRSARFLCALYSVRGHCIPPLQSKYACASGVEYFVLKYTSASAYSGRPQVFDARTC